MRRSERLHVGSIPAPAALSTEAIRTAEEPAWKAGGGQVPLVGSSPTASADWGHGPTGRRQLRTLEIRVRLPVTPLEKHGPVVQRQRHLVHTQETMVRLHPGPLPPRYANEAERLGLNPSVCGFDSRSGHWKRFCPRGAAWSARLPVTQEIAGSNPAGDALDEIARYANRQSGHDHRCAAVPEPW